MTDFFRHLAAAGLIALALESSALMAQPAFMDPFAPPAVPANIQIPEGNTLFLKGEAQGTQNYICLPSSTGFAWTFFSPQATLFLTFKWINGNIRQQVTTHFLSPNPAEGGTPRATWQSSLDSSAVWARSIASSTDTEFVPQGSIPWLLLQVVGTQRGPSGGNILSHATFIQRLNTSGGVAPATGCSESSNVGATTLAPYTADYFFFRASPKN